MMIWVLKGAGFASAVVAGVFFSFSDFVMRGLAIAPNATGGFGMVGLNKTVYRSGFMLALLILVPTATLLGIWSILQLEGLPKALTPTGSLVYFAGVIAITGLGNVPLNDRLAAIAAAPGDLVEYWPTYVRRWTRLNHVRTVACSITAATWLAASQLLGV